MNSEHDLFFILELHGANDRNKDSLSWPEILSSLGVLDPRVHSCYSLQEKTSDHLNHSQALEALALLSELLKGTLLFWKHHLLEDPLWETSPLHRDPLLRRMWRRAPCSSTDECGGMSGGVLTAMSPCRGRNHHQAFPLSLWVFLLTNMAASQTFFSPC